MPCYPILDFAPKIAVLFRDIGGIDLGHSYKAKRQSNGNFTILDLDVFKACQRKNNATGKIDDFSENWMAGAVQRFDELKRTGYLPPCHLDHHGKEGLSQPDAGKIGALRLGKASDGVPTLFADIVDVPPDVMAKMLRGRLSYRSVEVNNPDVKEISSLAFMATTVPYHKLPILQLDLDDAPSTFSAAARDRVLFADLYTVDPKQPHQAIVQKFYGAYGAWDLPTAMQQRMARGDQQDDGDDDSDDVQISEEDIAQLLPYLQQQQQGGQGGGGNQQMPREMQGDPMEEMMGNPDAIALLTQIAQQGATTAKGVEAILKGAALTSPAPMTPNPVTNAEPSGGVAKFSEVAGKTATTSAPANFADAYNGLVASFNAQEKTIDELKGQIYALWAERKRDEMYAAFSVGNRHLAQFKHDLVNKANFSEQDAASYVDSVATDFDAAAQDFIEKNIDEAMKSNDWRKAVDVAAYFADKAKLIPALARSAKQSFAEGNKPNAAQNSTATPRSTAEATKTGTQASDDEVKRFLESIPTKDRAIVSRAFNEKPAEAKTALVEARNAFAAMAPAQKANFADFNDFAAIMIHGAASNGAVHG